MKKIIYYLIPMTMLISSCREKSGFELFIEMNKAIQEIERVEYSTKNKIVHKKSFFDGEDKGICYFDFTEADSLFGPLFHFIYCDEEQKYEYESIFNGKAIIDINWNDSTVTKILPIKPEVFEINVRSSLLFLPSIGFLHEVLPQLIEEEFLNEENCEVEKLKLKGKKYYKITAHLKDMNFWYSFIVDASKETAFPTLECIIDGKTFLPLKISIHYQDWTDYETSTIKNLVINGPPRPDSIWNDELLPGYLLRIDPYKQLRVLEPGSQAPDFNLEGLFNDSIHLSKLRGKVVMLNFWSIGCGPCVMSIPFLNNLLEKYPPDQFELIGVNTNAKSIDNLIEYAKRTNMNFKNYVAAGTTKENYKIWGVPAFYLLNKSGKIEFVALGYNQDIEESVHYYLDSLIVKK
jgi:thiol-disulfide isomerase/thioredoxin